MRSLIRDMLYNEKKWRMICILATVMYPILIVVLLSSANDFAGAAIFFGFIAWLIVFMKFLNFSVRRKNYNYFLKHSNNPDTVLDSFHTDKSSYSNERQIYLGDKGLFYPYAFLIIPYDEFAWMYMKETNVKYNAVSQQMVIYTKNRKKYELTCSKASFMMIANEYFVNRNRNILIGYTKENKQKYFQSV